MLFQEAFMVLIIVNSLFGATLSFDLGFAFTKGLQDIHETLTFDPQEKQKLKLQHLAQFQNQKEALARQNLAVPQHIESAIQEKTTEIKEIKTTSTNALSSIVDTIMIAQELSEIRTYVSDFHGLKMYGGTIEDRNKLAWILEGKVNQLNLVKTHCTHLDVVDLADSEKPYERLKSYCNVLNTVPQDYVMSVLNGG